MRRIIMMLTALMAVACTKNAPENNEQGTANQEKVSTVGNPKQLNITILLDLSDRIDPTKYPSKPEHYERDIDIVDYFTEIFKKDMEEKGAYNANGKMKVIFSPRPDDDEINEIASQLTIDLSTAKTTKDKKAIFDNVSATYKNNLERIYKKSIESKSYPGSDIWRFFKNDVVDYAVSDDANYRNILVLITDGYLYHKDSKDKKGNRSMSLTPQDIQANGFRSDNWSEKFEKGDYGYITTRDDLNNLDILVLEINPSPDHKNDEDVIKAYLSKWFKEMNVNKFELYNSDLPQYTQTRILKFVSGK